jgi:NADH-quinone oxidoreductase subunit I
LIVAKMERKGNQGMFGIGILKGLGVALKRFVGTFVDDLRWLGKRYFNREAMQVRQGPKGKGVFTVQYPEEQLPVPERFRCLPVLLYEEDEHGERRFRCTACGICAKICPPQCIWIVRASDPQTGRPVSEAAEFSINIDLCMNCGLCAEFCPFDSIKMDHNYELAFYNRGAKHLLDREKLARPVSYYASIRPMDYAFEEEQRAAKEAAKRSKQEG